MPAMGSHLACPGIACDDVPVDGQEAHRLDKKFGTEAATRISPSFREFCEQHQLEVESPIGL